MGCLRLRPLRRPKIPLQTESVGYGFHLGLRQKVGASPLPGCFQTRTLKEGSKKQFKIEDEDFSTGFKSVTEVEGSEKRVDCVVYEFWHKASQTVWFVWTGRSAFFRRRMILFS